MTHPPDGTCPAWDGEVLMRYAARLYPAAFRMTRNGSDAGDLVQETLVKAIAAAGRLEPGSNLGGWLHTIMTNTFISGYRRRLRAADVAMRQAAVALAGHAADTASAEDHVLDAVIAADIAAMRPLPDRSGPPCTWPTWRRGLATGRSRSWPATATSAPR